jgi:ribosomal protein RSM22 (predicted rRNA methylase)
MDLNQDFLPRDHYDIIIIGSTLCELQPAVQYPLITNLLSALTDSGVLFVLEPALKATARNLHQLRDTLLAVQRCRILAPCTRQTNCPCLENDRDWCHESRQVVLPPRARQLSVATGLRTHDVKWSYMTVTRSQPSAGKSTDTWRIVSDLMKLKGKQEIFVCGRPGRLKALLQKRDKSAANKPFKKLRRGQRAHITHTHIKGDVLVLGRESTVTIEEPILQILS